MFLSACVSNSPTQCLVIVRFNMKVTGSGVVPEQTDQPSYLKAFAERRRKDVLMAGTVARGGARAALSPLRMDSCIADPQQELLIVFKERNLR